MEDSDSVSSHGSRRSARLFAKRQREEGDEQISVSSANSTRTPKKQRKNSQTSSSATRPRSTRRSTTDLKPIPENITTTTTDEYASATTVDTPQIDTKVSARRGSIPAISASQLKVTKTPSKTSQAVAPRSSKKLLSLDGQAKTPLKQRQRELDTSLMNDDEEAEEVEEVLLLPKEETTAEPVVPEAIPETFLQKLRNRGHLLLCRHGHYLETMRFWMLFFFILQIVLYPIVVPRMLAGTVRMADMYANIYKSFVPKPVDRTPYLKELEGQLQAAHELEKQTIRANKHLVADIRSIVQEHVEKCKTEVQTFAAAQEASVLNLTMPALWNILRDCSNRDTGDDQRVSVTRATEMIREDSVAKRNKLKEESDVDGWIRQHLPKQLADRNEQRLQRLITERIEEDRADFDFTDKVLASTGNFVNTLPWGNRLLALWGLRFYGNGPEAAIVPTTPRSAEGHCWALVPPATATIQLTDMIYVQSISIEHPSQGKSTSAIRKFAVEGIDAQLRSWPLGTFVYDNQERRQDYMVRDEYNGEEIPPVLVVKLIIDSGWGDDYACLYRFRVFGEKEEQDE